MKNKLIFITLLLLAILTIVLIVAMEAAVPVFIVFLVLKLCSVVAWNWFVVFLPLIIGFIIPFILLAIRIIVELIK